MAGNGDAQRLEKLEMTIRGDAPPTEETVDEFTLRRLADFFVAHGQQKQELTYEYASRMLDLVQREMTYLQKIVGKMPK